MNWSREKHVLHPRSQTYIIMVGTLVNDDQASMTIIILTEDTWQWGHLMITVRSRPESVRENCNDNFMVLILLWLWIGTMSHEYRVAVPLTFYSDKMKHPWSWFLSWQSSVIKLLNSTSRRLSIYRKRVSNNLRFERSNNIPSTRRYRSWPYLSISPAIWLFAISRNFQSQNP